MAIPSSNRAVADPARSSAVDPDDWTHRLQAAMRKRLAGDILTWAEEATTLARRMQARRSAGLTLLDLRQPALAFEQFELALQTDASDAESLENINLCQQQLEAAGAEGASGRTGSGAATERAAKAGDETGPCTPWEPRQVLLFSGHRIDTPERKMPRFTPAMLPTARRALDEELNRLQAGPLDLAFCQAAAGGDLVFLQACHARGVRCHILLPFDEGKFIDESILASIDGQAWLDCWSALKTTPHKTLREMPAELGPLPDGRNAYERCNRWLLNCALACGPEKLHLLCLWNGGDDEGPGGVRHLMDEARRRAGVVCWIDTRTLAGSANERA